jgi:signal transduction histidine kinase/ligand-binding sensor domain-containing protein
MRRTYALLIFLSWSASAFALDARKALTQYSVTSWTQQQGLPQDTIHAITQTTDGYLWLGTDEGLARFDGYEFTIYGREHGDMPSNSVTALAAGTDGSLWIGTHSGLTQYRDRRFRNYSRKDGLADNSVSALFVDHAGILWIVAGGNLSRFDGTAFRNYIRGRDIPTRSVRAITEDSGHTLYVAGNDAVMKLVDGKFVSLFAPHALDADFPSALQVDRGGNLWVTGVRGLIERLPDGTVKRFGAHDGLSDSFGLNAIREDRDGTLWVGTDDGLARREGSRFRTRPEADGAGRNPVRCLFEDREGNLWAGTNNGLTRFRDDVFTIYGKAEGLPGDEPLAVHQDRSGTIWVGFSDGLTTMMPGKRADLPRANLPKGLVRAIRETRGGELLVASRDGLARIGKDRVTTFVAPDPQGRKTIFDAMEDSGGGIWLALPNGLGELRGNEFRTVVPAGPIFLEDSFDTLAEGRDGSIWAGTMSNGLWRVHKDEKRLYTTADGLGSNQIRSLYTDPDGTLWISTLGGGLNAFRDEKDAKFEKYTARDGLLSDNIWKATDDGESLWLSTTRGICRIPKSQLRDFAEHRIGMLHPIDYGAADGLRSLQTTDAERHADGSLWFVTNRGLAVFEPGAREQINQPPLVHIVAMTTDGRQFDWTHVPRVPPGSGRLQIRYTAIHLRAPERVRYSYKLSNLDANWVHADNLRAVNYNTLGHGHYEFTVRAELPGGPANETSFDFDLLPRFYETAWFRVFGAAMLAGLVWGAYRLRVRQVHSRFGVVLEERARLAREVHDTLAQAFVGISSQLDVVEMCLPAGAAPALTSLELARRMAQHSLTEARRSVMDLRATALDDQDLTAALNSGARLWTAGSGIDVKVDASGDAAGLPEDVAHHVFRIAQEAVTNVLKHAGAHEIAIHLKIQPKRLSLSIVDDGCGFEQRDVFTSMNGNFGLIGMRERAERLGGELRLESRPGGGTTVSITVPLK